MTVDTIVVHDVAHHASHYRLQYCVWHGIGIAPARLAAQQHNSVSLELKFAVVLTIYTSPALGLFAGTVELGVDMTAKKAIKVSNTFISHPDDTLGNEPDENRLNEMAALQREALILVRSLLANLDEPRSLDRFPKRHGKQAVDVYHAQTLGHIERVVSRLRSLSCISVGLATPKHRDPYLGAASMLTIDRTSLKLPKGRHAAAVSRLRSAMDEAKGK